VLVEHVDHHNASSCSTSWECFDPELHVNLVDSPKKLGGEKWLELGNVIY
jgi:hypothetical protein